MPTTTWTFAPRPTVPAALQQAVGGHPLVAQTLVRRGLVTAAQARAFLDPAHYTPAPPEALPDLEIAVERLTQAIRRGERILVWGDFDVDGQTATTVLVQTLRDLRANVRFHIPLREREGHGIRPQVLQTEIARGVDVLLTCDTGISAHEALAVARRAGVDVLVTDHHALPETLPPALARINPQRLSEEHPLRPLPGVGVAWKLAEALYARFGRPAEAEKHLDLVALGIVADVAPQIADARYLLQRGLEALRRTSRLGLQTLFRKAELQPDHLTEEHIGFVIGPRLNALGRLADANVIVKFLTTSEHTSAEVLAERLEGLNLERRRLTEQITRAARAQVERDPGLLNYDALVLHGEAWHPGVVGIVASRLVEEFGKPVVLLTGSGDLVRGSARSIPGVDIIAAIAAQADMLTTFGGHPMAAGLALPAERVSTFRQALSRTIRQRYGERPPRPPLTIDGELPLGDLSPDLVADIERLAPFGAGNPPLTLISRNVHLMSARPVGREGEHLLLEVADGDAEPQRVIWWRGANADLPEEAFDLAYTVRTSTYRGQKGIQIEWIDYRLAEGRPARLHRRLPEVLDLRSEADPWPIIRAQEGEVVVWAEGPAAGAANGLPRHRLPRADVLVIWTTPPDRWAVIAVLERVQPARVLVCAQPNALDTPEALLRYVAGLLKYAVRARGGQVNAAELAGSSGQREAAIHAALNWLREKGLFSVHETEDGWLVSPQHGHPGPHLAAYTAVLRDILTETAAFRRFWAQAPIEQLVAVMRPAQGEKTLPFSQS